MSKGIGLPPEKLRRLGKPAWTTSSVSALAGVGVFLLLGVLISFRRLVNADLLAQRADDPSLGRVVGFLFPFVAGLYSPVPSVSCGVLGSLLLWRLGLGRWSLAPLAFLLLVPLEMVLEHTFQRPPMPPVIRSWSAPYPLSDPSKVNTFPSGSAIRTGFLWVFLAVVGWKRGGRAPRLVSASFVALALLSAFVRVYGRYHWLSDELAGMVLGSALALLVAAPVASRLRTSHPRGRSANEDQTDRSR